MNFGLALLEDGKADQGIPELIRAAELRSGPVVLERLGDAFTISARDYPQAIRAYTAALAITPDTVPTELFGKLARAHFLAGNLEEAARIVAIGKQSNSGDIGVWIADGFVLWKQGRWNDARYSLRRSLAMAGGHVNSATFFSEFMGRPADVGLMLADLRSSRSGPSQPE
jgi:tetratricopeptide (TPR) repeat protein